MWNKISEKYEASSEGHIRNTKTQHILREFEGKDGYLRTQYGGKTRTVHRVIAEAFIPREEGKEYVNHKDGNKRNNTIDNLEWCTFSENQRHAYANNLRQRPVGTTNPRCRLSDEQVEFIRNNYKAYDKQYGAAALSKKFGVAHQTICAVASGQNWNNEKENENVQD